MKWIFLLAIFAFLQYVEVKGYPQFKADENLHTIPIVYNNKKGLNEKSILGIKDYLWTSDETYTVDQPRTFYIIEDYLKAIKTDTSLQLTQFEKDYIKDCTDKFEFIQELYKEHAKRFLDFVKNLYKKKDEKNPSLGNIVLNKTEENVVSTTTNESTSTETASDNKTEENVVSTTPTNESTNTETASDNKTEENVVSTTSINESTSTETASDNKTEENVVSTTPTNESTNTETASDYKTKEDKIILNHKPFFFPVFSDWSDEDIYEDEE